MLKYDDVSNKNYLLLARRNKWAKVHKEVTKDEKVRNHVHHPSNSRR